MISITNELFRAEALREEQFSPSPCLIPHFRSSALLSHPERTCSSKGWQDGVDGGFVKAECQKEDLIETRGCGVGIVQIFILISVLSIKLHTLETVDGKTREIA